MAEMGSRHVIDDRLSAADGLNARQELTVLLETIASLPDRCRVSESKGAPAGRTSLARTARIGVLDGWRGVSIIVVIAAHIVNYRLRLTSPPDFGFWLWEQTSTAAVCIFFTLSGFIIVRLALEERASSGRFAARAFYLRRAFRILPAFLLYLGCIVLMTTAGFVRQSIPETLTAAMFVCNMPTVVCGWFAGHSWSLAYEEQFYLLLPLLLVFGRLQLIVPCLCALFLATPFMMLHVLHAGDLGYGIMRATFYFSFIGTGALAAVHEDDLQQWAISRVGGLISIVALAAFLGSILVDSLARVPYSHHAYRWAHLSMIPIAEPILAGWLIVSVVHQSNPLTRLLSHPWLTTVGAMSFSLYLWQQAFTGSPAEYPIGSPLYLFPLLLLCAFLSYRYVEKPLIRIGRRVTKPPP